MGRYRPAINMIERMKRIIQGELELNRVQKNGDTQFVNSSCRGTQTLRINDARIYW